MSNPNIINVSTITGKTTATLLAATSSDIVANAAASGKILKINSLYVANTSSNTVYSVTVDLYRNSTSYKIANSISVPNNSTLIVIDKNSDIYLEEGDTIRALGSSANYLNLVISYEEIS